MQQVIKAKVPAIRDQSDLAYISEAMKGYGLSGSSGLVVEYEQKLANFFNVEHVVVVSSGTAAIHCALMALGIDKGDEVILPVTAPVMTALPIIAIGAKPVFVDTNKFSFGICLTNLEKVLSNHTRCVISVPMWGYSTNIVELSKFTSTLGLPLIEDAAQAIGTITNKKYEGTFGTIGCFSTHELKLISTGEGGFVATNEADIADRVRELSKYGMIHRKAMPQLKGKSGYSFGLNYKLNSLAAALGLSQLTKLDERLKVRRRNAQLLIEKLETIGDIIEPFMLSNEASLPNNYACIIRVKNASPNLSYEIAIQLKQRGISTDFVEYDYRPLYEYPLFNKYVEGLNPLQEFPNALALISSIVILPTHEHISSKDIDYIYSELKEIFWTLKILRS